jgi:hypothetical protein
MSSQVYFGGLWPYLQTKDFDCQGLNTQAYLSEELATKKKGL